MQRLRLPFIFTILGLAIIIGGIGYGVTTKKVTLLKFAQGTIAHYLSNGSKGSSNVEDHVGYLQMANSSDYFLVREQDFTPAIHGTNTFQDGQVISFTYDPSDMTDIDAKSSQSQLQGSASAIVEIISLGDGSQTEYTTSLYRSNPNLSYTKSNWSVGLDIATGGAILVLLSLVPLFRRRRVRLAREKVVPRGPAQPYQAPEQPARYGYGAQPGASPATQQPQQSQPGLYPPVQQQQFPSQPGFYPPVQQQQFPSQPGLYPPVQQPQQQPFPSQPGFYPPVQQQPFPSQPGLYPPVQQPATQYPEYPPQQDQYDQTQQAPDPYNR